METRLDRRGWPAVLVHGLIFVVAVFGYVVGMMRLAHMRNVRVDAVAAIRAQSEAEEMLRDKERRQREACGLDVTLRVADDGTTALDWKTVNTEASR